MVLVGADLLPKLAHRSEVRLVDGPQPQPGTAQVAVLDLEHPQPCHCDCRSRGHQEAPLSLKMGVPGQVTYPPMMSRPARRCLVRVPLSVHLPFPLDP
jgi:hypothetical protein